MKYTQPLCCKILYNIDLKCFPVFPAPFSLDDLPPPPEDLLDTLDDSVSPFPTSTTPYKVSGKDE